MQNTIEIDTISDSMTEDTEYIYRIKVKNTGALTWNRNGTNPIYLGYHWIDFNTKEMVVFDGKRSIISNDGVEVGQETEFDLKVIAPSEPGEYILQLDLVHEGTTWFSYQGVPPLEKFVSVGIGYSASYNDNGNTPNYADPGEEFEVEVSVKNTGMGFWESEGPRRTDLGHSLDRQGYRRSSTSGTATAPFLMLMSRPSEEASVKIMIQAPDETGKVYTSI